MLFKGMNIFRLMKCVEKIEDEKMRERSREVKKDRIDYGAALTKSPKMVGVEGPRWAKVNWSRSNQQSSSKIHQ